MSAACSGIQELLKRKNAEADIILKAADIYEDALDARTMDQRSGCRKISDPHHRLQNIRETTYASKFGHAACNFGDSPNHQCVD